MKYNSIKVKQNRILTIPPLLDGVNKTAPSTEIKDTELCEGINIWNENSLLKTRPGLYSEIDDAIDTEGYLKINSENFKVTDVEYIYESERYKIAYTICFPELGSAEIPVYLIGENRKRKYIGKLTFQRVTDSIFYSPTSIKFFVGSKGKGGGIYAFVHLANIFGDGEEYRIYEVLESLDGWQLRTSDYIPTVLINGRGNNYETAKDNGCILSNAPKMVESLNLLNSSFVSYYTSDGFSSNFCLPFSSLKDSTVMVRVYDSQKTYTEWILYGGITSKVSTFEGTEITVSVDREKGVVYFTKGGLEFAVPRYSIYSENNIRILANKEIDGGAEEVLSCKLSEVSGSRILFSGGIKKNKIYPCKFDNPLYFPYDSVEEVGSSDKLITALKTVKDKVYAFKENEIYAVSLKAGAVITNALLVLDEEKTFYKSDELSITAVSKSYGTNLADSVAVCDDMLVWLGNDGNAYAFKNSVFKLGEKMQPLSAEDRTFAVAESYAGYYLLCYNEKAVIIDVKSGAMFVWEFPEEVRTLGMISGEKPTFVMMNCEQNLCFLASFKGNEDIIISKALSEKITLPCSIESVIKTKDYSLCNFGKRVNVKSVCLFVSSGGNIEITLAGDNDIFQVFNLEESDFHFKKGSFLKIFPDFPSVNILGVTIKSKKSISFLKGEVYFWE